MNNNYGSDFENKENSENTNGIRSDIPNYSAPDSAENTGYEKSGSNFTFGASQPENNFWQDPSYKPAQNQENFYSPSFHSSTSYNSAYTHSDEPPKKEKPAQPKKPRHVLRAVLAIVLCVVLSASASGAVSYFVVSNYGGSSHNAPTQVVLGNSLTSDSGNDASSSTAASVTGDELSASSIYSLACQSVVGINTSITTTNVFGQQTSGAVSGSGFVISSDGYIMTNYHVVEYSATYGYELSVMFSDGSSYPADIVGYEQENDIAIIKVAVEGLTPVTFGNSDNMQVGDTVYAVGNPLGELTYSMTSGMVSALDRVITTDENTSINMFQIDAAVNSGNSGGPVFNSSGEVIGIVTAKYSSTGVEGLGFAIPVNDAVAISSQLIENGYVTGKAALGIVVMDVQNYASQYYNLPSGAYVYTVSADSCAAAAGLRAGDIITKLNDTEVASKEDLTTALKSYSAGDTVTLTVYRSNDTLQLEVTLDEKSSATAQDTPTQQSPNSGNSGDFGYGLQLPN